MNTYFQSKTGFLIIILFITGSITSCNLLSIKQSELTPEIDKKRDARLLTAFFGRDSDLPRITFLLSPKALGKDGMPLVFSQEVDPESLDVSDFEITTLNGSRYTADGVTLRPANEPYELRTVLLVGEYGDHPDNPPVSVKIVGDLMSRSGQNYKGQEVNVIPLDEGPILSYAEFFTFTEDYPYVQKGRGCDCPKNETKMIVRAVWSGGVKAVNGKELGQNETDDFKVTLVSGSDTIRISPFQLADLKDNDNNIDLCLNKEGKPLFLEVNANVAIDPNKEKNPMTRIDVKSRW